MKIGVLGAPGSGKSKFARALAKEFDLKLVDGYVQRLQNSTNLALGRWASYSENFMVAGYRLAAEEKHKDDRITVGTIADTIVYAAVKTDITMQQTAEHRNAAFSAAQGAMSGLGIFIAESWDYNICFYLPFSDSERAIKGRTWEVALDSAYPSVIESFGVQWVYPLQGTHEQRIKIAKDIIRIAKEQPSETE